MTITLHTDPVPLRLDETDTFRVGNTRITLDVLVDDYKGGLTPEEIVRQMPTLTLADVHGALAYYFRHQTELDEYLRRREEEAEQFRQQIEGEQAPRLAQLKAKLDAFKSRRGAGNATPAE
jgi:uncharacterized protein (DUF433 family)